jgi:Cu(I)/Ag(I) efflux system periplasmic protein CusF
MKKIVPIAIATLLAATGAWAAGEGPASAPKSQAQAGDSMPMAEGEVRKVDADSKKITLKHGEIKNLGMPGMTMVFQVQDPAVLGTLKVGDKVRFMAERQGGAIIVTHIEAAR